MNMFTCDLIDWIEKNLTDKLTIDDVAARAGYSKWHLQRIFREETAECGFVINTRPVAGECPFCHFPLLAEKKTAKGPRLICASKLCGKPIPAEEQENQ